MALIRMRLQKALPLLQHQHVQKTTMVLFHLLFQISKEKLLCSLQSLPTLLSLYHEGFACSHLGVSSFWFSCFHVYMYTCSLRLQSNVIISESIYTPVSCGDADCWTLWSV